MHSDRSLAVQPGGEFFHQKMYVTWSRRYVTTNVDLGTTEVSTLDGIHVTKNSSMDFSNVLYGNGAHAVVEA